METFYVKARRTTTEAVTIPVEADSLEEAQDTVRDLAKQSMLGAVVVDELLEEQVDVIEEVEV